MKIKRELLFLSLKVDRISLDHGKSKSFVQNQAAALCTPLARVRALAKKLIN